MVDEASIIIQPRDVALRMRLDYSHGVMDHTTKIIDEISSLCAKAKQVNFDANTFLRETAEMI